MTAVRKPEFITFTGLDERTDLKRALDISARYPVEWGVLFSGSRMGQGPRYPDWERVDTITAMGLRLAAHLCGEYARQALMYRAARGLEQRLEGFSRHQINYAPNPKHWPDLDPDTGMTLGFKEAAYWYDRALVPIILQSRTVSKWPDASGLPGPARENIQFLYDLSGGKGKAPAKWPPHPGGTQLVGYAGGIGPENVASVLRAIDSSGPYWIDMEGQVRDQDDWLDLDRVEAVCAAVYD